MFLIHYLLLCIITMLFAKNPLLSSAYDSICMITLQYVTVHTLASTLCIIILWYPIFQFIRFYFLIFSFFSNISWAFPLMLIVSAYHMLLDIIYDMKRYNLSFHYVTRIFRPICISVILSHACIFIFRNSNILLLHDFYMFITWYFTWVSACFPICIYITFFTWYFMWLFIWLFRWFYMYVYMLWFMFINLCFISYITWFFIWFSLYVFAKV